MTADKNHISGFRAALDWQPRRPSIPTFSTYAAWSEDQQADFDEARTNFMLDGLRISLPHVNDAIRETNTLAVMNAKMSGGRAPLIVDALPTAGKTETAMACARQIELLVARRNPSYRSDGIVPVAWCEVPSGATGKALARAIYSFYTRGLEPPNSWSNDRYLSQVVDLLAVHGTRLLVLDEAHNIAARAGMGQGEASDNIKEILNRSNTTVLMAGVRLEESGLLTAARATQLTDRAAWINIQPAPNNTADARANWRKICRAFDNQLPLMDHVPGLLTSNSELLHAASKGLIGPLAELIQRIFLHIIADPDRSDETVTPDLLQKALVDWSRAKKITGLKAVARAPHGKKLSATQKELINAA